MSINDATPAEWDEVTSKVRSYKREIVEPTRFRYKDGEKDLRKAKWYLEKLLSFLGKSNVGS